MIAEALLVFTITWWIGLFISLPIKVYVDTNVSKIGCASSAPSKAYLGIKVLIVTISASVLTAVYCYLKVKGYVDIAFSAINDFVP